MASDAKPRTRILLIEDNAADAEMAELAFASVGAHADISVLQDGEDAIGQFSEERPLAPDPAFVLLDLNLPRVGGFEVLEAIKSLQRTRHIPVVVLTSSESQDDILRSYRLGASSYVVKPMGFSAYREMARCICEFWLQSARLPSTAPGTNLPTI